MSADDPNLDDLIRKQQPPANEVTGTPKKFTPGVDLKGDGSGSISVNVEVGRDPQWDEVLSEFGFGGQLEVLRVDRVRMWDAIAKGGEVVRMKHLVAKVVQVADAADLEDVDELKERIWSIDPGPSVVPHGTPDGWLVVPLADWQGGKAEGGGSAALVDRVKSCVRGVIDYVTNLRMGLGLRLPRLCLVGLGDLVEGCGPGFPGGTMSRDLHMRQQRAVVRGLLVWVLKTLRPYFDVIQLRAVPGNHGQNRAGGGKGDCMHPADNADVGVVDSVRDVMAEASWNDGISVWTTSMVDPELHMSWDLDGVGLLAAHGHQTRGGVGGVPKWVQGMIGTGQVSQRVQVAMTGHYHHLRYVDMGNFTWLQAPALDGGSAWFSSSGGEVSRAGMLAFACLPGTGRGIDYLRVIDP